jgi:pentatricopeptide repeat protein
MVSFAADCGEHELAKHFYSRLCSLATPNLRTCMTILQVHSKQGDWQAALAVYRDMQARKIKIDGHVLNSVMGICAAAGMASEVEQLLAEADFLDPVLVDTVSYNTVIKAYAQCRDYTNAVKVLNRMRAQGVDPNNITYNTLIDAAARTRGAAAAWDFYQDMVTSGFPGDKYTCSILIKTLSLNPTGDRIRKCLDLLREVGHTCDQKLRTRLYHNVIEAALQLGDSTVLTRSFSQTRLHRVRPSAALCRQLKELADQCKGLRRDALKAAVGDEGAALGSTLEENQPGGHKTPKAGRDHDEASTGKVSIKPQALVRPWAMQRRPCGSTSEEPNRLKDGVLGGPTASENPRASPAMQWRACKV